MCIVAIAWQVFADMPLVLISNRDEFLDRPTLSAHQWQDMPIFAGRDELSGGTWLGHHHDETLEQRTNGRWATVLNFRDGQPLNPEHTSRGQLVTDFLTSNISPMDFARQIHLTKHAGFNLIVGDAMQAVLVNNRGYAPTPLHTGLHVISNGQPTDEWVKCERLRTKVYQEVMPLISQGVSRQEWQELAFRALSDTQQAPKDSLPNTGMPAELEHALSSIFIAHDRLKNYGTRTQSILTLSTTNDEVRFAMQVRQTTK